MTTLIQGLHETEIVHMEVEGPTSSLESMLSEEEPEQGTNGRPAGYTWIKGRQPPTSALGQPLAASTPTGRECIGVTSRGRHSVSKSQAIQADNKQTHQNSILLALCVGNPPVTDGFPSQRVSDAEVCTRGKHALIYFFNGNGIEP